MEKLKITRLGEPKTINYTSKKTGKPDSFQKVGFQSQEHGEQWYDFAYRGAHNLTIGNEYEFELISREYNGKTYWDAKLPKKEDKIDDKLEMVLNKMVGLQMLLTGIDAKLDRLLKASPNAQNAPVDDDYPENTDDVPFP